MGLENPKDLVLTATLPGADLIGDARMDERCDVYRSDRRGESYTDYLCSLAAMKLATPYPMM